MSSGKVHLDSLISNERRRQAEKTVAAGISISVKTAGCVGLSQNMFGSRSQLALQSRPLIDTIVWPGPANN